MGEIDYRKVEFPLKAKYVRHENRIYFITDWQDGEELTYYGKADKPNSNAKGYRFYRDSKGNIKLVHYNDIVGIESQK